MPHHDDTLRALCRKLIDEQNITTDPELAAEIVHAAIRLVKDAPGRADSKLVLRTLKELRYGFKIFRPYQSRRKVSIFGSARTLADDPDYKVAADFGRAMATAGYMVITGAGGGIMEAGNEGAGQDKSFGVAIKLPFEQATNPVIAGDEKLAHFRYFFSRKLMLLKETHAVALFPGGFGTHDEAFEVLTLISTGRTDPLPLVMLERPGGDYWNKWERFVRENLLDRGFISPEDMALWHIAVDVNDAVAHIHKFYGNYHSMRYQKDDVILRIAHPPDAESLAGLAVDFADLLRPGGAFHLTGPEVEPADAPVPHYARLVFPFNRRAPGRLRMLIDRLNQIGKT